MKNLVIVGIAETAWRVYQFVNRHNLFNVIGFAADKQYIKAPTYCGKPIFDIENLHNHINVHEDYIFVAIFWNHVNADRRGLYERMKSYNMYKFASLISPLASVRGSFGENCWINDFVVIQEAATIDDNVYVMDSALIGHKSTVHSHSFIAIKSTISGACSIGEQTFIGTSALIFDRTKIGDKCIVGGGTIVKRNVPSYTRVKVLTEQTHEIKTFSSEEIEEKLCCNKNVR